MALDRFFKVYMPYCMEKQEDGSWLFLNREYKPLGFNTREWVEYEDHAVTCTAKGIRKATLELMANPYGCTLGNRVYLYQDGTSPAAGGVFLEVYMMKLKRLAIIKVGPVG